MDFKGLYKKELFTKYSVEDQQKLFEILNNTFKKDAGELNDKLNKFFEEAHKNNIAVIDFLSSLYYAGEVVEANLYFASCLAIYAGANGSKLALNRVKELLNNSLVEMENSINKEKLFVSYNLDENNFEEFLLNHICFSLVQELNLNLDKVLEMRTHLSDFDEFMVLDIEDACVNNQESMIAMLGDVK